MYIYVKGVHKILCFFEDSNYILDSGLSRSPLGVSVCTQWQVKHQRCSSRTCIVKKNHNILRKNTISNEHPVPVGNQDKMHCKSKP